MFYRQGCTVEWRYTESGDKVRVSTRSGKIIPIPSLAKQTYDYKTPNTYKGLFILGKFRMRKSIKKIL